MGSVVLPRSEWRTLGDIPLMLHEGRLLSMEDPVRVARELSDQLRDAAFNALLSYIQWGTFPHGEWDFVMPPHTDQERQWVNFCYSTARDVLLDRIEAMEFCLGHREQLTYRSRPRPPDDHTLQRILDFQGGDGK